MRAISLHTLRHDRALLVGCLALATVLSWWYLVRMAGGMPGMEAPMSFRPWATFIMWMVMMVGMMLPGAAPGILMFAAARPQLRTGASLPYLFALGYLLAWAGYAALATTSQWGLHALGLLSYSRALNDSVPAGLLVLAAGAFQWTPLKHACLYRCRSPLGMVAEGFPASRVRALRAGILLGLYCAGCCWALMALMFIGGVMNLAWMALLTLVILLEKLVSPWKCLADGLGLALVAYGGWLLLMGLGR
ncbi:DUF2182 domain-containing protein [Halomonas daqiaonensis]|uniref:Predicted metal-binding membrane protein n=1 Tax=Halomonas daqiaonensis TaxID=650850 RepID=A0A1H7Q8C2_9GAMM|nr:DUF2182 domain-containing protein [Halomonas daqiaonensis]SEL43904.1 Predicted metal-binding membrane protein [Halomonas daqiaonensis]